MKRFLSGLALGALLTGTAILSWEHHLATQSTNMSFGIGPGAHAGPGEIVVSFGSTKETSRVSQAEYDVVSNVFMRAHFSADGAATPRQNTRHRPGAGPNP